MIVAVKDIKDHYDSDKHRYQKAKNRSLKCCYVPATSAAQNRLLFFAAAVYSTTEANKASLKQSKFLDVYGLTILGKPSCPNNNNNDVT